MRLVQETMALYRLRVRPLPDYDYPLWRVLLLLAFLGVVMSGYASDLGPSLAGRIGFCIAIHLLETFLMVLMLGFWLGIRLRAFWHQLLTLVVFCSMIQLLFPLLSWLPDDVASGLLMLGVLYAMIVLCHALAVVSGKGPWRVFSGVVLFSLLFGLLTQGAWYLASRAGLVTPPSIGWNPFAPAPNAVDGAGQDDYASRQDNRADKDKADPAVMP